MIFKSLRIYDIYFITQIYYYAYESHAITQIIIYLFEIGILISI